MKHAIINCLILMGCSTHGMKRPANAMTEEPASKRQKTTFPIEPARANQHYQIIAACLNNALAQLGTAQEAVEHSSSELELRMSQLCKDVEYAKNFASLLTSYQILFDDSYSKLQQKCNYLTHFLENTKKNVVDTYFDIAFSTPIDPQQPQILPNAQSMPKEKPITINVETDGPILKKAEMPIEAIEVEVHTAEVVLRKSDRIRKTRYTD